MNRKQLAPMITAAGFSYTPDTVANLEAFDKFAKLIIEECIDTIWTNIPILDDNEMTDPASRAWGEGMTHCMNLIDEHFGIEQ